MNHPKTIKKSCILLVSITCLLFCGCEDAITKLTFNKFYDRGFILKRYLLRVTEITRIATNSASRIARPSIVNGHYDLLISAKDIENERSVEILAKSNQVNRLLLPIKNGSILGALATKDFHTIGKIAVRGDGPNNELQAWLKAL